MIKKNIIERKVFYMFGLTPYEPRKNQIISRRPRDVFDNFFNDDFMPMFTGNFASFKTDIRETETEFIIDAEMPGVSKDNIKIDLNEDILSISVERNEEKNEEKSNYIRRERRYGSSSRSFNVGNVKQDEINAKFDNGILSIHLPKLQESRSEGHSIDIQ